MPSTRTPIDRDTVELWLERLYVAAEGARLRQEDRRKAIEVTAMLAELGRAFARCGGGRPLTLVDAAAGKAHVGLLAAKLLLEPAGRGGRVVTIEREPERVAAVVDTVLRLGSSVGIEARAADVADRGAWPPTPDVVVALHACGPAADVIIDQVIALGARQLLLVPCCTSALVPAAAIAARAAEQVGIPRHAPVRRRFVQALVDAERTCRLEAAGYQTEVVELVPPTVTPHNLLWRSRRVGEPGRMAAARASHARLTG